MATLLDELAADHRRIFGLLNELTGGAGIPHGSPQERRRLATRLVMEESRHETAEEECFWPVVKERVQGGAALALAATTQEQGAKRLLHELDHISAGNEEFASVIDSAASSIRDHIFFEESQVWPKLALLLDQDELSDLGEAFARARTRGPTRPHPHLPPPSSGPLRAVSVAGALADQAMDVLTRRGR